MRYIFLPTPILIDKCTQRDHPAWTEFIRRYKKLIDFSIKKTLYKYIPSSMEESVKDIRQSLLLNLWNNGKLDDLKDKSKIDYWIAIVARNAALDYLKTSGKERAVGGISDIKNFLIDGKYDRIAESLNAREKIKQIYESLNAREKLIFRLYFMIGKDIKYISGILNLPVGSITSSITRLRKKIKRDPA